MSDSHHRRLAAISGLAFVTLDAVALFLPGRPPKASDSAARIAETLAGHRTQLLVGMYVAGLSLVALAFFLGSIRRWIARERGDQGLATTAMAAAILGMAAQLLGLLLFYGATFKVAGQHADTLVRGLTDGGNAAVEVGKFGFAALIVAVCLAGRDALSTIAYRGGLASASVLLLSAVALFGEGRLTQFGGGFDLLGSAPAIVWLVALSVRLGRPASTSSAVVLARAS